MRLCYSSGTKLWSFSPIEKILSTKSNSYPHDEVYIIRIEFLTHLAPPAREYRGGVQRALAHAPAP